MWLHLVLLFTGILLLVLGANWLVTGASAIARTFKVSNLVIGLTVVAFGTSTPELVVSVFSATQGQTDLAIGTILGSNIANTFLILGTAAVVRPLVIRTNTVRRELPFSVLAILVVAFQANDRLLEGRDVSELGRIDGLVLLGFFSIFLFYSFSVAQMDRQSPLEVEVIREMGFGKASVYVAVGLVGLSGGGKLIVENASALAAAWGFGEREIGLTVVAVGTSLPELAAGVEAARRDKADLVMGSVIGSNIFNLLWILGLSASVCPLEFHEKSLLDIAINVFGSLLVLAVVVVIGRRGYIERLSGGIFVLLYFGYVAWTVIWAN